MFRDCFFISQNIRACLRCIILIEENRNKWDEEHYSCRSNLSDARDRYLHVAKPLLRIVHNNNSTTTSTKMCQNIRHTHYIMYKKCYVYYITIRDILKEKQCNYWDKKFVQEWQNKDLSIKRVIKITRKKLLETSLMACYVNIILNSVALTLFWTVLR